MALTDAVRLMRGKVGTEITLTVVREGATKPLKVTLKRAVIKIQSVKSKLLEPGFGYVRITQFQAGTEKGLNEAVRKLGTENKGALRGVVLDLRNNPGGVLNGAVAVSDAFLNKGLIVYTEGRVADSKLRFSATPATFLTARRSWCWSTAARPRPRRSSPARSRTTSARSSWAPRPSARARCRPSFR